MVLEITHATGGYVNEPSNDLYLVATILKCLALKVGTLPLARIFPVEIYATSKETFSGKVEQRSMKNTYVVGSERERRGESSARVKEEKSLNENSPLKGNGD